MQSPKCPSCSIEILSDGKCPSCSYVFISDPLASPTEIMQTTVKVPAITDEQVGQVAKQAFGDKEMEAILSLASILKTSEHARDFFLGLTKAPKKAGNHLGGPYFRESYAKQIQVYVDEMLKEEEEGIKLYPRRFLYKNFPNTEKETVRQRIEQSIRYLIRYLDTPDNTYGRWRQRVEIQKKKDGIYIQWIKTIRSTEAPLMAEKVDDTFSEQRSKWESELDEWLEVKASPDCDRIHLQVSLSEEEVVELRGTIDRLNSRPNWPYAHSISASSIKIVKQFA